MNFDVSHPALLFLLPLALLPLIFTAQKPEAYPSLAAAETDTLSLIVDIGLRLLGAIAIAGLILGLSGLNRLGQSIPRIGKGANIVLLFDRSASMNDTFAGRPPTGEEESKSAAAQRFLKAFVANREHDRFGVAAFSTAPMFVLPLSDHKDATLAAIDAIELPGLALTDVGRGLVMAQAMQEADILNTQGDDGGLGSRAMVLVSDGAAVIDRKVQEKLQAAFAKRPIRLYWIFLRTEGSRGIFDPPREGDRDTPYAMPERHLNLFFEGLKVPYQAFEVENPAAVGEAIAAIDKLERSPIRYVERIPQRDLSAYAYGASALALFLLLLVKLAETKVAAVPGTVAVLLIAGMVRAVLPADAAAAELNRDQVLALIAAAGPDYGPDLTRRDLTGLDLSGVDFKRADLFAADLSGASVARANLASANLNRAILRETDLRGADLSNASMFAVVANGANFSGANLSGARVIGELKEANLDGAKLVGADLGADPANQGMVPVRVDMSRATLNGADLTRANLVHVVLAYVKLRNAKLTDARLGWANLSGADLEGAEVSGADFTDADLEGASLAGINGADSATGLVEAK
jgi:mxaC protein